VRGKRIGRLLMLALISYSSVARAQSQAVMNYAVRWAASPCA